MQRFEGMNGQIILDDQYLWLTREGVLTPLDARIPRAPRRVLINQVVGSRFNAGELAAAGSIRVLVEGAEEQDQTSSDLHPDVVLFAPESREEFRLLASLLSNSNIGSVAESAAEELSALKFLSALDSLNGLAAAEEIVEAVAGIGDDEEGYDDYNQLADELDILDDDPRVTWAWIGECWFAIGGTAPASEADRKRILKDFAELVRTMPGDAGTKQLANAVSKTALSRFSTMRLAQLWELVSHPMPEALQTIAVVQRDERAPAPAAAPSVVTAAVERSAVERAVGQEGPARRSAPTPTRLPTRSATVGRKWRVSLDCEGFRTLAVCDPISGETNITKGELEGRRFADPSAAAKAVFERYESVFSEDIDGWRLWILHDGSGRSIGSVRGSAPDSASRIEIGSVATPTPGGPASTSGNSASTSDRGISWLLHMIRKRGAQCGPIESSRRTALWVSTTGGNRIHVRVKSRTAGTWQAQKNDENLSLDDTGSRFWAFVDLAGAEPAVYILHSTEVAAGIRKANDEWVARDRSRERTGHHAIELSRISHGRDRWDLLGLRR